MTFLPHRVFHHQIYEIIGMRLGNPNIYPPGKQHILPGEKDNHFQTCQTVGGYASFLEGR